MKKCPNCKMNVDAYSECPICGADITKEPQSECDIEKYVLNKHFFKFLIKKHKFSIFVTVAFLISFFISLKTLSYWHLISFIAILAMWFNILFKSLSFKLSSWKYTDDYLDSTYTLSNVLYGVMALICAAVGLL